MTAQASPSGTPDLYHLIAGTATATTLRRSIGIGTLNFAVIAAWVALDTEVGPTSHPVRIGVAVAALATLIAAVMWVSTDRMMAALPCTLFGVFAEFGTAFLILSVPDGRDAMVGCALLAVLGAQFTLLMPTRWLFLHCAVSIAVIGTTIVRVVQQGQMTQSTSIFAGYVLAVSAILTPWGARIAWSRLLVYAARSLVDPLTSLLNRSGLEHALLRMTDPTASPPVGSLAVVVLDIDNFKSVNDTHGHLVGDQVIIEVAQMLSDFAISRGARVGRTGGEEFAMLIPLLDPKDLEELRAALPLSTPGRNGPSATLSAGIVRLAPIPRGEASSLAAALAAADRLMYMAKRSGGAAAITEDA